MTKTVDERGMILDNEVIIPAADSRKVARRFAGMKGQFAGPPRTVPNEFIRSDGSWIMIQPFEQHGMSLSQIARCILMLRQLCANPESDMRLLGSGTSMTLVEYAISGMGTRCESI